MNDRRRPRVPAKPKPSPQLTGPVQLDDETRNALILFNARLVAQDELEREKRRVDKAAKAKDEAAAKVRQLETNPKATAEQKSEAQAAYLASLDALNRAKAGEPAASDATEADTDADADETDDTTEDASGEPEAASAEPDTEPAEPETEAAEPEAEAAEPDTAEAEPAAEPEAEAAEPDTEPAEPETEPEAAPEAEAVPEVEAAEPEAGDEP